ncbi:major facilitator superfamily domain-containing protein [Phlyctochytrium arcticum]|nr:major facilitator superfamily domain-containing protein [Phlyctochytrium arcticum]
MTTTSTSTPKRKLYIWPKVLMFFLYFVNCSAPSYLSLIYQQRIGLTASSVGILSSIPPFVCIIAGPLLSLVADLTGRPRTVLATALISTTGVLWMFAMLDLTFASAAGVAVLYAITSAPIGSMLDVIALTILGEETVLYGQQRVWGSISCGIVSFVGGMVVDKTKTITSIFFVHTLMTCIFLMLLGISTQPWKRDPATSNTNKEKSFEDDKPYKVKSTAEMEQDPDLTAEELRQHMATSLPPRTYTSHTLDPSFHAHRSRRASMIDAARRASRQSSIAASLGIIPVSTPIDPDNDKPTSSKLDWLLKPDVMVFFISNTLLGAVFSVIGSFLWIYLTDELDANATVRGMTGTAQVVLQLPFFFFAKQVMAKLGVRYSILTAHFVTVIRFLIYPFLKPGPMVYVTLGAEALHGLAFSMNWTASVAFAAAVAPRGMEFMVQGILGAFYGGLGSGLGGIIGGFVYARFGSSTLFFGCAVTTALSGLLFLLVPSAPIKLDPVPPMDRVLDKQGSTRLMEVLEEGGDVSTTGRMVMKHPSAMAMAMSAMSRRNSMMNY